MTSGNTVRLSKLVKEYNVGISTIVEFLHKKGFDIDPNPNSKVPEEAIQLLNKEYSVDISLKKESEKITRIIHRPKKESISIDDIIHDKSIEEEEEEDDFLVITTSPKKPEKLPEPVSKPEIPPAQDKPITEEKFKVIGKIDLDQFKKKKTDKKPAEPKKKPAEPEKTPQKKHLADEDKIIESVEKEVPVKEELVEKEPVENITPIAEPIEEILRTDIPKVEDVKVVGKIDLGEINQRTRPQKKTKSQKEKEREEKKKEKLESLKPRHAEKPEEVIEQTDTDKIIPTETEKLGGPTVVGKIELKEPKEKKSSKVPDEDFRQSRKKRRKRISKEPGKVSLDEKLSEKKKSEPQEKLAKKRVVLKKEVNEEDVQKQIKDTLARLTAKGKSKGSKYRREKRAAFSEKMIAEAERINEQKKILKVTEFVSVNELATMMNVSVTQVISSCMQLGLFVSINQRLDAETMSIVAEEFGYSVEFVSVEIQEAIEEENDNEDQLKPRPPIVTVMGHVDHGKTSLLDYIRKTNVIAGEAGGITQHIGAYHVSLSDDRKITFLDTPGHEAFTAMRARGAQVTDIAIIIVAADDNIMPQSIEAINHAMAAGVPIVFAINKIDKPGANPEKIKESLANMNYLVEEWGGKYQSQDISAKVGTGIEEMLEKVLLEAELLDLKANPDKNASGTIIESALDRGRGYVATVLVQNGTLKVGDIVLAGQFFGHVKAMFNERNQKINEAGPAVPVLILGLNGAPQAGDKFNVMEQEREARAIANKREQLAREQGIRTQKHITLDEIGRRIAIGNFQQLNLIVKGDVDGSIEALSDSLIKLSTEEIQVNVIHKAVGQISESDIMLASASEAIVVGFQVRPSLAARKLAEKEQIDIRLYSIIYDAINEIKAAMEGMLSPEIKEEITGTLEILEVFKITKVGTVAGCIVRDGKILKNSRVRVIRNGIVIYTGELESLKRFKEDVKEVKSGYECGLNILNFNDIKPGDNIESFHQVEVAKQL